MNDFQQDQEIDRLRYRVDLLEIQMRAVVDEQATFRMTVINQKFDVPLWLGLVIFAIVFVAIMFGLGSSIWDLIQPWT